jgi:hypothetical protein
MTVVLVLFTLVFSLFSLLPLIVSEDRDARQCTSLHDQ